jgi:hypothetical protein
MKETGLEVEGQGNHSTKETEERNCGGLLIDIYSRSFLSTDMSRVAQLKPGETRKDSRVRRWFIKQDGWRWCGGREVSQ